MKNFNYLKYLLLATIICCLLQTNRIYASETEVRVAADLGKLLITQFKPERIDIVVSNGGSFVYVETTGAVIEDMRVDKIRIEAMLKGVPNDIRIEKKYELADMIYFSKGEVILLEKDVNDYFVNNFDIKGFSNVKCFFSPNGFVATGTYSAKFIFTFRINLKATGAIGLQNNGIYLENTVFYIDGVKQPDYIAGKILEEVNPLLEFKKDIPFPVRIKTVAMMGKKLVATGYPKRFSGGEEWHYSK